MKISCIDTGFFKLDGGAMFGIVPKRLWQRLQPPDANNLCTWAMRCLLIQTDDHRNILIDTGIGDKQGDTFRKHFEPHGLQSLHTSLAAKGLRPEDITDVLLTHLHFDHVGGAVRYDAQGKLVPTFPNATYWSHETHWRWALTPNPREQASFLTENFVPLQEAGVLRFVATDNDTIEWLSGVYIRLVYGHTEAMMLPIIKIGNKTVVYCADVIPSMHHIAMPYVMSYDVRPLLTLEEKASILQVALAEQHILVFEHDPQVACATICRDERGRIVADRTFHTLEEALP